MGSLVLIVDEDDRERRYIGAVLAADGFDVIQVSDSVAGMVKVTTFEPSLIILAAEGGPVPVSQLVRIFRRISAAPLIIIDDADPADEVESVASGGDLVLSKKFGAAELISRSRMLVRRQDDAPTALEGLGGPSAIVLVKNVHSVLDTLARRGSSKGGTAA